MSLWSKIIIQDYLKTPGPHKLEIGADHNGKPGWISTDLYEHANPNGTYSIGMDATKKFPFADNTFDYIYSEHMIEHITFEGGWFMLQECYRVCKNGGVIRVVTPTLEFLVKMMGERNELEQKYFNWSVQKFCTNAPIASSAFFVNNFMRNWGHTFLYDKETLHFTLESVGFKNVQEQKIGSSTHKALCNLEHQSRMAPGFLEIESTIFEGVK